MSRWRRYHLANPPASLRRPTVRRDNLALVPASLLPFRKQWQQLANQLPPEEVLIILPPQQNRRRDVFRVVAELLRQNGHHVTTLSADRLSDWKPDSTDGG